MLKKLFSCRNLIKIVSILTFLFSSCSNNEYDFRTYDLLNKQLDKATKKLHNETLYFLMKLEAMTKDPFTAEKATFWHKKAIQIHNLSTDILDNIDSFKIKLDSNDNYSFEESLYNKLALFQKYVSSIDTEFNNYFHKELNSITSDNDSIPGTKLSFIKYFTSLNKLYIKKSVLSRIQNNVSIIDKSIIEYCASQVGTAGGYISYDPVIWQNVTHLKRGEELKIKSGIGTFYNKFRPEMVINGKTIYTDEEGKLSYSLKVSDSLGKHTIPIKIVFYTWDSIKDSTTLYVEYFIDN